jgi:hypothetical protein
MDILKTALKDVHDASKANYQLFFSLKSYAFKKSLFTTNLNYEFKNGIHFTYPFKSRCQEKPHKLKSRGWTVHLDHFFWIPHTKIGK